MDQPGKVANPARGQLNRENDIPCPRACLRIWSRETGYGAQDVQVSIRYSVQDYCTSIYQVKGVRYSVQVSITYGIVSRLYSSCRMLQPASVMYFIDSLVPLVRQGQLLFVLQCIVVKQKLERA